eukprot:212403_1
MSTYATKLARDSVIIAWTGATSLLLFYKVFRHNNIDKNKKNNPKMHATAQLFLIGMCISYICTMLDEYVLSWQFYYSTWGVLYLASWSLFNVAYIAMYLFVFLRLYFGFRNSRYAVSNKLIFGHIFLINIVEVIFAIQAIFHYADAHPYNILAASAAAILVVVGLLHLEYVFNQKLNLLIVSARRNTVTDENDGLSQKQLKLIPLIVKQTVISAFICGIITLFVIINAIIGSIILAMDADEMLPVFAEIERWILVIVEIVVSTCIFLSFKANRVWYEAICKHCHNNVYYWCKSRAAKESHTMRLRTIETAIIP